ncbi:Peptidyl-lysine N-acetyltransferase YjaB [Rhodopseudomonas palustris]|uniref:GCN5-related N-acetyltransferase n=1 Tax=Rhodopseudomonas palustris (strain ATCC BAA-98 / CGA009) TaxID=258594 RepID=Q6NBA8_RHOPA|nr:GNAT family N-acetyltransferase [Rhodopseudomonas palustris]OPF91784.1 GNAT family N-acetyltransferase [Rhodopseudomonas palustris]QQM02414.1 Peptidyl-lysine N-acetyltransferase YjaB [Rhodopseudomonas palustris]RJF60055.1 GNAT family N-acetyltransferase [Rhodopseudomonas palustris]WAB78607.1 GNAT family N-acetyltransferase [Rhodopseudomonas palustris]WCL91053.1 GNAT family N-acetyltransferase [Rhodopseudomonas palustris CGA009]
MPTFTLRPYTEADEDPAIALWLRTWQLAYPAIDFTKRVDWWRERWRTELVPQAAIIVAEQDSALIGFVTIDAVGYLDQLVVEPEHWGWGVAEALVDEAKQRSPTEVTLKVNADNYRAIKFYRRNGFAVTSEELNSSGRPVLNMLWRPA